MIAVWDVAPCSLMEVDRRFREAYGSVIRAINPGDRLYIPLKRRSTPIVHGAVFQNALIFNLKYNLFELTVHLWSFIVSPCRMSQPMNASVINSNYRFYSFFCNVFIALTSSFQSIRLLSSTVLLKFPCYLFSIVADVFCIIQLSFIKFNFTN
jgi:hypothetical protein